MVRAPNHCLYPSWLLPRLRSQPPQVLPWGCIDFQLPSTFACKRLQSSLARVRTLTTLARHEFPSTPRCGLAIGPPGRTAIPGFPASPTQTVFRDIINTVSVDQTIELLLHAKDAEEVERFLDVRAELLFEPNACALLRLLERLVRGPKPELALQVFAWKRKQFRSHLDSMEYAKLIDFAGSLKKLELADSLYIEMQEKGVPRTVEVQNALMAVYARNDACRKAFALLQEVLERKDSKPTLDTFTTALSVYGKLRLVRKMEGIFEDLKSSGLKPTTDTFNALIWGYRMRGFWQRMGWAFEEMKASDCRPTAFTFSTLIRGYAAANLHGKMEDVVAEMRREGYSLRATDAHAMIFAYSRSKNLEMIERILGHTEAKGSHLRVHKLLIKGYAHSNRLDDMEKVVEDILGRKENAVSPRLTAKVVKAYLRQGAYERLDTFLTKAKQAGWIFNRSLNQTLLILYRKYGLFGKMDESFKQMLDSGIHPHSRTYKLLLHAYESCGRKEAAIQISEKSESCC